MKKLDCFGEFPPVPLLKAKNAVKILAAGDKLMLVTDHRCVVESLEEYFSIGNFDINKVEAINGVWEITISKH